MRFIQVVAPLAVFANAAIGHGNHNIREEIKERRDFLAPQKRTSLGHCSDKLKARGLDRRNIVRRAASVQDARVKRQVKKRTEDDVLATDHNKTSSAYTEITAADTLFADYQSCLLTPLVTQGPYYVADEYVRRQISEDLEGVPIVMDFQVVDTNTCEPMPNTYLEIRHANATGVYAGVEVEGNGSGESDPGNLNKTWGRGIQETNADGVPQFESIFPGHYTGRAIHIHTVVHKNATLYQNSTLGAETITSHIGQVFFDQDLISLPFVSGPYHVSGEMIRSDTTEDQVGVPLYLDVQFIDTTTCEPVEGVAVDYWHANATGDYSGISSQAGLNTTWLRGIQVTDASGVVGFQGIIPGHYTGRTHHVDLLAHSPGNWTTLENGTITGGNNTPHIGQVFFDQDLVDEVETLSPYTLNTQSWTKTDEDNIFVQEAEATGVDPMANYVLLGDSVADGVLAWISVGIDPSAVYEVDSAVQHTADGGVEDPCFLMITLTPDDPDLPPLPASCTAASTATATATASA
ncbi:hypothetical protein LQW54_006802 [Pestalotiopsis sp. IQ-011]